MSQKDAEQRTNTSNNPHSDTDEIAWELSNKLHEKTVGYGDRFPTVTDSPVVDSEALVVRDTNNACGVCHRQQGKEIGYDITLFRTPNETPTDGASNFIDVLQNIARLGPIEDYVRVYRDLGRGGNREYPDSFLHVWVDERILIATTINPIVGRQNGKAVKAGSAGYMGVGGQPNIVTRVDNAIVSVANPKDRETGQLFY